MRKFDVPVQYRSEIIGRIKNIRREADPRKQDLEPSVLDFGPIKFILARHFGFCFGVENAIEISYRSIRENPGKRVFLISEMIHNPRVNDDLVSKGVQFLRKTNGETLFPVGNLTSEDVVIVPAFGAPIETMDKLAEIGLETKIYDTTCPFVTRVWRKSEQIGERGFTVVLHGKRDHEETRASLSNARKHAAVLVIRNIEESEFLADVISGKRSKEDFYTLFEGRYTDGFDCEKDLARIGVVNQTTMLATETKTITDILRKALLEKHGEKQITHHFADTSDTLCYATNENQSATRKLIEMGGDVSIVVGGYNSSNTSHLVELSEEKLPTYFISGADQIISLSEIKHFDLHSREEIISHNWLPGNEPLSVVLTSGASCPDAMLDEVIDMMLDWFPNAESPESAISLLEEKYQ